VYQVISILRDEQKVNFHLQIEIPLPKEIELFTKPSLIFGFRFIALALQKKMAYISSPTISG